MTVELRAEDQTLLQELVDAGQFGSLDEALHESIQIFAAQTDPAYRNYVEEAIAEGLADADAGRVYPVQDVLRELKAGART